MPERKEQKGVTGSPSLVKQFWPSYQHCYVCDCDCAARNGDSFTLLLMINKQLSLREVRCGRSGTGFIKVLNHSPADGKREPTARLAAQGTLCSCFITVPSRRYKTPNLNMHYRTKRLHIKGQSICTSSYPTEDIGRISRLVPVARIQCVVGP